MNNNRKKNHFFQTSMEFIQIILIVFFLFLVYNEIIVISANEKRQLQTISINKFSFKYM